MEAKKYVYGENIKLLKEIYTLKVKLNDLYVQNGPNSSDYIDLSIKLNLLEKKYMEEKLSMYQEEFASTKEHVSKQAKDMGKKGKKPRKSLVWHVLIQR